jgi:hypothetical protein
VTWSFSEGLSSNTRGTGASEKGSSEFFGRRNRRGFSPEKVTQGGPGEKAPKCSAKCLVVALKLAQLRLNGETCGPRPAVRRRTSRAKFFAFALEPVRAPAA